jgi:pimeloyl-ACP methyl ester carboxylesterase
VCIHGFTATWRAWELVLPALERRHDVLVPTLTGHAAGPAMPDRLVDSALADGVERAMDEAGFATAHLVGNSLGGYIALQLAARGRAESVVALAPAGGWAAGDESYRDTLQHFSKMLKALESAVPHIDSIVSTREGRRVATEFIAERYEHIPAELVAHQMLGAARCDGAQALIELALGEGWNLPAEALPCPVRFIWGTEDRLLKWPGAAARFQQAPFEAADWVVLDGVGHCPQLDVPAVAAELILEFVASSEPSRSR